MRYNPGAMKRLLLLLVLLIAVPLQSSWAAMSGYCEYEKGAVAQHFGHHSHHHHHAGSGGSDTGSAMKIHHDCSHHTGGMGIVVTARFLPAISARSPHEPHSSTLLASLMPDRPERPKWSSAVI